MVLFLYEEPCDVRRQFGSGLVSLHLTSLFGLLRRPLQNKPFTKSHLTKNLSFTLDCTVYSSNIQHI